MSAQELLQQFVNNTQYTIQTLSFKTHFPPPPTHLWISNTTLRPYVCSRLRYSSVDASRLQTSCYKTSRYQQSVSDTCCTIQTLSFKTHITPPQTHLRISTTAYHSHEVIKTTITLMPAQPPAISWQALYMLTTQHRSPFLPYPIVPSFPFHPTPYHHA